MYSLIAYNIRTREGPKMGQDDKELGQILKWGKGKGLIAAVLFTQDWALEIYFCHALELPH